MAAMPRKSLLTDEQRKQLKVHDRRRKRSDNRFKRGTKKHPGGCVCCGSAEEAEARAMRRPFGKTPRRPQAKRQKKALPPKPPSLSKDIAGCRKQLGLKDWKIRGEWVTLPDRDDAWVVMSHNLRIATIYIQHRLAGRPAEVHEAVVHECVHISLAAIHQAVDNLSKGDKHDHFEECIDTGVERLTDALLRLERQLAIYKVAVVVQAKEKR